MKVYCSS